MDELEKIAVTLKMLRRVMPSIKKRLVRRSLKVRLFDASNPLTTIKDPKIMKGGLGPMGVQKSKEISRKGIIAQGGTQENLKSLKNLERQFSGKMFVEGDTSRTVPRVLGLKGPKSPAGKEFYNRSVLSHELAELSQKHPGRYGFAGHHSLRPPLQDLNIAATAKGPGSAEARKAILAMRKPEMKMLAEGNPDLKRLNLGKKRLSRHNIKRVQEIYDRHAAKALRSAGQNPEHSRIR